MDIMGAWRRWSQKQYDVWGSKIQEKYDFWKAYDDPVIRLKCQQVWASLSPDVQKKIYDMLIAVLKKYGPEFAKKLMIKISEPFLNITK